MEHRPLNPNHITHMTTHPHLRPITPEQITEIKKSRQHASELFKRLRITGWPKVVTPEPGKHFLTTQNSNLQHR